MRLKLVPIREIMTYSRRYYALVFLAMCVVLLYAIHGYYSMLSYNRLRHKPFYYIDQQMKTRTTTSLNHAGRLPTQENRANATRFGKRTNAVDVSSNKFWLRNITRKGSKDDKRVNTDGFSSISLRVRNKGKVKLADDVDSPSAKPVSASNRYSNKNKEDSDTGSSLDTPLPSKTKRRYGNTIVSTLSLVLFTTWSDDMDGGVRNNTCYNWGSLRPLVHPVLFTNSSSAAGQCKKNGWTILPLTQTAAGGAPVLKFMFSEIISRFNSTLYGYSNGDILFGDDLLQTLSAVHVTFKTQTSPLLVVGVRTNVNNVKSLEASSSKNLREAAKKRGKLFISVSEDYFITNKAFPWDGIPEVVVGRVAYDNWLVLDSIHRGHTVIDATETILAVHQTTRKGNFQGRSNRRYPHYNRELLSRLHKNIYYSAGSTQCVKIITKYSMNGEIFALKRNSVPTFCQKPYG
ncbi:uncharacterized protein LOC121388662 [Gigantopelta aegis]|uniref:uncharacterized protein LOC121388662 n=1 Tax=Gigantopelta aegis TaxID=1735272 RepID=UPI001B88C9EF|nr:uncharacterized protein LOC121388662 [Gigantopelta aegis]XP_041376036.1 uncharacterized protein LOC121388662 [Gigantopelta aegis]XP_041376037.1 uncharacterized protein LOC121388662 [Gigantopelta aegis]